MSLVGKSIGNYRVVAKIGEGGMGAVYLGEHPLIGKRVAIKTLHPDLAVKEDIVSRFFTEAKAVNDIAHPNIVDIVDFGKTRDEEAQVDVVYFVMEFLDGEGLNSRLKREGVSPREAIHILTQCASALAASHKKNIVHRDLKPENIYLVHRGEDRNYCKLLDFGIAKLTGEGQNSQHQTRAGLVMGTPAYMSPEQCEGKGNIDWRSDVYSLGVVFYEMLTGRVPFTGEGFGELLIAHLTKMPELPSTIRIDVPAGLEAIVMHAMEKDKNRRFQSMDEFIAAMNDPQAHLDSYGSPSGRQENSNGAGTQMMDAPDPEVTRITGSGQGPRTTGSGRVTGQSQGNRATGQSNRPTTLSGAAGEAVAEQSGGKSKAPLFAVLGVLVVGGAGGAVFFAQKQHPETQPTAIAPAAAPNPENESVKITINTVPAGAQVFRAGVVTAIGTTPFPLNVKRTESDFDVQVKMTGFREETRTVTTDRNHEMLISLTKVDSPAPAPVAAAPAPAAAPAGGHADKPHHDKAAAAPSGEKKEKPAKAAAADKKGGSAPSKDRDDVLAPEF